MNGLSTARPDFRSSIHQLSDFTSDRPGSWLRAQERGAVGDRPLTTDNCVLTRIFLCELVNADDQSVGRIPGLGGH